ncbi:MAG TPA: IclR family transcriptional regulator [Vineibacter sp.]|nr:IclR family transcriptional regulator [Vineibacter sp.]
MSTLANAIEILKLIARLRRDITVTDLVVELGLPKSSASRTLKLMAEHGFLDRDASTRAYRPGGVIMEASYHYRASLNAASLIEEAVDSLVRDTGCTGYINVLVGAESLVIRMRVGAGALQVYTPPGTRAPAYASSVGRAILARLDDDAVLRLVGPHLETRRGHIPRTHKDLLQRLAQTRADGWALSLGEYVDDVAGVASSVSDPSDTRIYGLGLAMPAQEATKASIERYGRAVRDAARTVGVRVGDPYWLAFAAS